LIFNLIVFLQPIQTASEVIFTKSFERSYMLSNERIIEGSEKVMYNFMPLEKERYEIDYWEGVITLDFYPKDGEVIFITYDYLEEKIERYYFLSRKYQKIKIKKESQSRLNLEGLKTFSVTAGDGGFGFDQGVTVTANGKVGDYSLNIHLTDETQSYGESFTEDIENLDRITFEIKGKNLSFFLGDVYEEKIFPERNDVRGGLLKIHYKEKDVIIGAGLKRSIQKEESFYAQETKQGPYFILKQEGRIIPGSERVFLNGELLENGKDYVMDYDKGSITFLPCRPLSSKDLIYVKFLCRTYEYPRYFYAVSFGDDFKKVYVSSSQDGMKNYTWEIDTAFADTLKESQVMLPGGVYVGAGKGEYERKGEIFIWKGKNKGDYSVFFTPVDTGDYVFIQDHYEYVGKGMGNYLPFIKLTLPQAEKDFLIDYKDTLGKFMVDFYGGVLQRTPNLYNPSWTLKRTGFNGGFYWGSPGLGVGFSGRYHTQYDELLSPFYGVDIKNLWGVDSIRFPFYEGETFVKFPFLKYSNFLFSLLFLNEMKGIRGEIELLKRLHLGSRITDSLTFYWFSYQYSKVKGKFSLNKKKGNWERIFDFKLRALQREDFRGEIQGFLSQDSGIYANTVVSWELKRNELSLMASTGLVGKDKENEKTLNGIGALYISKRLKDGFLKLSYIHNLIELEKKRSEYIWVGEGKGDYAYDEFLGEYVKKRGGGYIRIERTKTGSVEKTNDFELFFKKEGRFFSLENTFSYFGDFKKNNEVYIYSMGEIFGGPYFTPTFIFEKRKSEYLDYDDNYKKEDFFRVKFLPFWTITPFLSLSAEVEEGFFKDYAGKRREERFKISPSYYGIGILIFSFGLEKIDFYQGNYIKREFIHPQIIFKIKKTELNTGYEVSRVSILGEVPYEYTFYYPFGFSHTFEVSLEHPFTESFYLNASFYYKIEEEKRDKGVNLFIRSYF